MSAVQALNSGAQADMAEFVKQSSHSGASVPMPLQLCGQTPSQLTHTHTKSASNRAHELFGAQLPVPGT